MLVLRSALQATIGPGTICHIPIKSMSHSVVKVTIPSNVPCQCRSFRRRGKRILNEAGEYFGGMVLLE